MSTEEGVIKASELAVRDNFACLANTPDLESGIVIPRGSVLQVRTVLPYSIRVSEWRNGKARCLSPNTEVLKLIM
jgi:hypothetical protein